MSLKEQDRATLVVLGLEKSDKMLDAANWLIEEKQAQLQNSHGDRFCFNLQIKEKKNRTY